jgi:FKBP-type peptidyl-prolyl cis-trans isomerase FklB
MFIKKMTGVVAAVITAGTAFAAEVELKTDIDKANYSVGYQVGSDFKSQNVEVNMDALVKGIEDALSGGQALMTPEERHATLTALRQKIAAEQQARLKEQAAENLAKSKAFMAENAGKDGVTALPSGLQYKIIAEGSGASPTKGDKVTVHYRGTLIDGTEFDSSFKRNKPAMFGVSDVIAGWTEALQLMKEGSKWQLFIPPALGYGASSAGQIPPNSTLIFEVELISINK